MGSVGLHLTMMDPQEFTVLTHNSIHLRIFRHNPVLEGWTTCGSDMKTSRAVIGLSIGLLASVSLLASVNHTNNTSSPETVRVARGSVWGKLGASWEQHTGSGTTFRSSEGNLSYTPPQDPEDWIEFWAYSYITAEAPIFDNGSNGSVDDHVVDPGQTLELNDGLTSENHDDITDDTITIMEYSDWWGGPQYQRQTAWTAGIEFVHKEEAYLLETYTVYEEI